MGEQKNNVLSNISCEGENNCFRPCSLGYFSMYVVCMANQNKYNKIKYDLGYKLMEISKT